MTANDLELLEQYARHNSEEAFATLVGRHLDLVYSAALRQVNSPQLAEEVTQSVFTDLARSALKLRPGTLLTAWLYQVTRRTAIDVVRKESSRRVREQIAMEMADMKANPEEWAQVRPLLDEAMATLEEADRNAVLLRYFENRSLREVGQTLGTSEDAAQKRVSRAVERLREFLSKQGTTVGASSLAVLLSANAVQSAPAGLQLTISAGATLAGVAVYNTTAVGAAKTLAMTTIQKTLVAALVSAAAATAVYQAHRAFHLKAQLQAQQQQQAPLMEQVRQLRQERDEATNRLNTVQQENERLNREIAGLPKLRGEVSRLRTEARELAQLKAGDASDPMDTTIRVWRSRVEQLKQRLDQTPESRIPELKLLTEKDWLDAVQEELKTDTDYRRALSRLRGAAELKVISRLQPALKKYLDANNAQFPTALSQISPYLQDPLEADILQRYDIVPADEVPSVGMGGDWIITQKAPVDRDYDSLYAAGPNGWGSSSYPSTDRARTFRELGSKLAPALEAFKQANGGRTPTNPAQLQPYITGAEQQAAFQRILQLSKEEASGETRNSAEQTKQ